jgi:NAD(P)-dependent dehydrogenase (short-subunit alcohol dehydrogenase family)
MMSHWSLFDPLSVLGQEPQRLADDMNANFLTNVVGNTHLINFFMPLILKGNVKKVLVLTTGMADHDMVLKYGIYEGGPYAIGKAALNMVTSKFQAEFQKDGVLFIGISPGVVETGLYSESMSFLSVVRSRSDLELLMPISSVRRESTETHDPEFQIRSICAQFQGSNLTRGLSQSCFGCPGEVKLG